MGNQFTIENYNPFLNDECFHTNIPIPKYNSNNILSIMSFNIPTKGFL